MPDYGKYGRRGAPITFHDARMVDRLLLRVDAGSVNARAKLDLNDYHVVIDDVLHDQHNQVTEEGARAIIQTYREEGTSERVTGSLWFAYDDACRRFLHGSGAPTERLDLVLAGFRLR